MIRRLKKLVAENACFCFLADRSYLEEMQQRMLAEPYSIEHTYFTHQLFIAFRHTDMAAYLHEILGRPGSGDVQNLDVSRNLAEEQLDHAVLPYILKHAAQMHAIDLLRQRLYLRSSFS
jgi:hypothetical protein